MIPLIDRIVLCLGAMLCVFALIYGFTQRYRNTHFMTYVGKFDSALHKCLRVIIKILSWPLKLFLRTKFVNWLCYKWKLTYYDNTIRDIVKVFLWTIYGSVIFVIFSIVFVMTWNHGVAYALDLPFINFVHAIACILFVFSGAVLFLIVKWFMRIWKPENINITIQLPNNKENT